MRKLIPWTILFFVVMLVWQRCSPIARPPGILALGDPVQILFAAVQPEIQKDGWTLKPLATYHIEARVLSVRGYSSFEEDKLAPYDLALGWGAMSDTAVLEKLDISQSNRFYHWRYWGQKPPVPDGEIITHSANTHIIPADKTVLNRLKSLRKGSVVSMSGFLVEATNPRVARPWRSSLTRDDTGDGACELMYVTLLIEK